MKKILQIVRVIDALSDWTGRITSGLIFPLVGGLAYDVFARYLFNAPTVWAYDVTCMLYGGVFMLGAAYTLYRKGHMRTDIFYHKFPVRWQGIVDAFVYIFFFFPGIFVFLIIGADYAYESWIMMEKASMSSWRPPVYPFKAIIPMTALLLLIQGVSELIKSLYAVVKGEQL